MLPFVDFHFEAGLVGTVGFSSVGTEDLISVSGWNQNSTLTEC